MIATLAGILAKIGLGFLGDWLLKSQAQKAQTAQTTAEQAGANKQVIVDTAQQANTQEKIAQAEASTDKSADGVIDAARKGEF